MKKRFTLLSVLLVLVLVLTACGGQEAEEVEESPQETEEVVEETTEEAEEDADETEEIDLRLTTTTSVNDSGLMDYLREPLKEDTGINMEIVSKGSGAAIEDGRLGNADVILVHSPSAEQEFVDEGYGLERNSFMYNYFVIVGPADDPAGIKGLEAEDAFASIAETEATFVSRGDDSGTHNKEKSIWEGAGIDLAEIETQDFYNALGDGMGATLTFASENQGYTLTDLSTFLSMKSDMELEVLVDESESLKNVYSIIIVNPDEVEGTDFEGARAFEEWMTGDRAAELIKEYGVEEYGQPLFFVD